MTSGCRRWKLLVVLVTLISVARGAPAPDTPKDETEVVPGVPSTRDREFIYGGVSPINFLTGFNDIFERMRQQMAWLLSQQLPSRSGGIPIDLQGKGNTTSVTKVVDGHLYTVNETVYSEGDETAGSVFKIRVVDIRPADGDGNIQQVPAYPAGKVDDSFENDVNRPFQKREEASMDALETFDEVDESNNRPFDLSNDLRVNELAAAEGRPPNPDSEWIRALEDDLRVNDIAEREKWTPHPDSETVNFENEPPEDVLNVEHEDLLDLPDDSLADDLRVNSLAKTRSWAPHPDVEIIDFGNDIELGPEYRYESDR